MWSYLNLTVHQKFKDQQSTIDIFPKQYIDNPSRCSQEMLNQSWKTEANRETSPQVLMAVTKSVNPFISSQGELADVKKSERAVACKLGSCSSSFTLVGLDQRVLWYFIMDILFKGKKQHHTLICSGAQRCRICASMGDYIVISLFIVDDKATNNSNTVHNSHPNLQWTQDNGQKCPHRYD